MEKVIKKSSRAMKVAPDMPNLLETLEFGKTPQARGAALRQIRSRKDEFNRYFSGLKTTEEQQIKTKFPKLFSNDN